MQTTTTLQINKTRMATTEVLLNEKEMCEVPLSVPANESQNSCSNVFNRQAIRSNYMDKSIEAKKKVIGANHGENDILKTFYSHIQGDCDAFRNHSGVFSLLGTNSYFEYGELLI